MQSLRVSLVQEATVWHSPADNRALFAEKLADLESQADLILLPEMFSTGFTMASREMAEEMDGATVAWLVEQAGCVGGVVAGSVVIVDNGSYFNRFIFAFPNGEVTYYDKRHLFRMGDEHHHYKAGSTRTVLEVAGWRVCPMVCYDLRFPVWFRNRGDYDVIVCVANWPAARREAWNTLLRARAIENQCYVCAVNIVGKDGNGVVYGGGSAVYAPDGAPLAKIFDRKHVQTVELDAATLERFRTSFPVEKDADGFEIDFD
ncbi:MAG: omega-amidase [Limisphaerales bacterium]|jgi:omega-amidase